MKYILAFLFLLICNTAISKDLIIISADWCPACVKLKRFIDNNKGSINYNIDQLDIEQNRELAKKLGVLKIPASFIFDDNGKLKSKKIGYDSSYYGWLKENEL